MSALTYRCTGAARFRVFGTLVHRTITSEFNHRTLFLISGRRPVLAVHAIHPTDDDILQGQPGTRHSLEHAQPISDSGVTA